MTPALSLIAVPVLMAGTLTSPAPSTTVATAPGLPNIVETAVAAGRFNTLVAAVTAAELDGVLSSPGTFTVFAPTDAAFAKVPADRIQFLLQPENKDKLTQILTFHVAGEELNSGDVVGSEFVSTLNGQRAYVSLDSNGAMIQNAKIIVTDIQCSNGVIHVIEDVIFPELRTIPAVAAGAGVFDTLGLALSITKLDTALAGPGPFTVFAPTDDAFALLPPDVLNALVADPRALANVLGFHVTPGRLFASDVVAAGTLDMLNGDMTTITTDSNGAYIENAQIIITDIPAANGVIHVIDAVLVP